MSSKAGAKRAKAGTGARNQPTRPQPAQTRSRNTPEPEISSIEPSTPEIGREHPAPSLREDPRTPMPVGAYNHSPISSFAPTATIESSVPGPISAVTESIRTATPKNLSRTRTPVTINNDDESLDEKDKKEVEKSVLGGLSERGSSQSKSKPRKEVKPIYRPKMRYAKRRSIYLIMPIVNRIRESQLKALNDTIIGEPLQDKWLTREHEEQELADLFDLLDELLQANPVPGRIGRYYVSRDQYEVVFRELESMYTAKLTHEPGWRVTTPPEWPGWLWDGTESGEGQYPFEDLENLCILYRHLVETWLATIWELFPLTMEQRIDELTDDVRAMWNRYYRTRESSEELQHALGSDYEAKIREDAEARLTLESSQDRSKGPVRSTPMKPSGPPEDDWEFPIMPTLAPTVEPGGGRRTQEIFAPSLFAPAKNPSPLSRRALAAATSTPKVPRPLNDNIRTSTNNRTHNRNVPIDMDVLANRFPAQPVRTRPATSPAPIHAASGGAPGGGGDSSDSDEGSKRSNANRPDDLPPRRPRNRPDERPPRAPGYDMNARRGEDGYDDRVSWIEEDEEGNVVRKFYEYKAPKIDVPHIDMKLKPEQIEEWDGDTDAIVDWMEGVNFIAERSAIIYHQLGMIVPTRFRRNAKTWWQSLPVDRRRAASQNWDTLKQQIRQYYMGRTWLDKQKIKANNAAYRDATSTMSPAAGIEFPQAWSFCPNPRLTRTHGISPARDKGDERKQ